MASVANPELKWDLTPFFPSITSPEYRDAVSALPATIGGLEQGLAELASGCTASKLARFLESYDSSYRSIYLVAAYTNLSLSTDANDQDAQKAHGALQPLMVRLGKFGKSFDALIGSLDPSVWESDEGLADFRFVLGRIHQAAAHLLSPEMEDLAADLADSGNNAWGKLYDDFSSNIQAEVNGKSMSVSAIRGLAYSEDADIRRRAHEAELQAWKVNEIPLAAAMNAIKGEGNTLAQRRNWPDLIDESLFRANMDRASLEAMLEAARESFPHWRRYLKAKAGLLGHTSGLPFYDLFAPVGDSKAWSWTEAEDFVEDGFRSFSDKLADFARHSFDHSWHDVYPKQGKRDGAFCAGVTPGVSRMLYNFKESFNGASTLAHELGHAYHNLCLKDRHAIQKRTPMTLAETASIFCETIIKRRAIAESSGGEKLAILEASLQGSCQTVVDITSRYIFESEVVKRRKERALTPAELCSIMEEAQTATYGDGLDPQKLHPYMWAAKPHYYSDRAFYNFPYMFGLLFSLGLYRVYEESPNGFHDRYDSLLSRTGMGMAADLTQEFGIDIGDKAFWQGSLAVLIEDIDIFCSLASQS
ncbi:MAG: M3 family oligoendopeptidase [Armatimonadetes bacterium]|nr:M3 family oligoendopeptidase [Armatimonadota bacterium]